MTMPRPPTLALTTSGTSTSSNCDIEFDGQRIDSGGDGDGGLDAPHAANELLPPPPATAAAAAASSLEEVESASEAAAAVTAFADLPLLDDTSGPMTLTDADLDHAGAHLFGPPEAEHTAPPSPSSSRPPPPPPPQQTTHLESEAEGAVTELVRLEPEVRAWMEQCRLASGGLAASEDDVLFLLDSKYAEFMAATDAHVVFAWLEGFLARPGDEDTAAAVHGPTQGFSAEVKRLALQSLASAADPAAVVNEIGLKCPTTLFFWRYVADRAAAEVHDESGDDASTGTTTTTSTTVLPASSTASTLTMATTTTTTTLLSATPARRRGAFQHEATLLEWVLAHRATPLTTQDIVQHMTVQYPDFVVGRSMESLAMWVTRFLKRHLPVQTHASAGAGAVVAEPASVSDLGMVDGTPGPAVEAPHAATDKAPERPRKRRQKRSSPQGYVLHSNEFKLNALKMLDEGKTVSEVAEELGLKCSSTLVYWNSIRDKLAVADKKRFRLAGGGRRSTCTFEDELMAWVTDRHDKGIGTGVKCVLDYLHEHHPSFTQGKKEPTLRKWILRFFQRWRQPSICTGASTDDHHADVDDDELAKTTGILV